VNLLQVLHPPVGQIDQSGDQSCAEKIIVELGVSQKA
jgi:hypothetical protein